MPSEAGPPGAAGAPLFSQHGVGPATTASFKVPDNWKLAWSFDCSAGGSHLVLQVAQAHGGAGVAADPPINTVSERGSGLTAFKVGGRVVLDIASDCSWTVEVPR